MSSNSQKIAEAVRLKEQGNKFVAAAEYKQACKTYRRVFAYINGLLTKGDHMAQYAQEAALLNDEESTTIEDLRVSTYTNLALCYLKLAEPEKAFDAASQALAVQPNSVKALYRLASASIALRRWDKAKEALRRALAIEPSNAALKSEVLALKAAIEKWEEEQREKSKVLFGGKLL
jgi:peptidylprolyl isomerase